MSILTAFTLKQNRQLLWELTLREIRQRYKQSVLGYFWVILSPALQMVVMSFVFSFVFKLADVGVPYSIFLFSGLLPWTLFSTSLQAATGSLVSNAGLIRKIYFPREILVLSNILAKNIDFFLSTTVFIAMMFIFRIPVTFHVFWVIPILLIQNLLTYGIGLMLSAFNLFYRDIQYLINLILLLWMYLTPIMYSVSIFPEKYRWIFRFNPMAIFVNAYREVVLSGGWPNFTSLGLALFLSLVLLGVGFKIFKKLEGQFADVV
ncbi:ABC transporter permease [Microgenomates group bacterium]|nr:ABC transporter permease [Microgenomates group bacterium]